MPKTVQERLEKNLDPNKMISVPISIPMQAIQSLLISAFEGGSGYWNQIQDYKCPKGLTDDDFEFPFYEVPLIKGGELYTMDVEEMGDKEYKDASKADKEKWTLTLEKCIAGLKIMAEKCPRHFGDVMADNTDATTADVFLQCCLLGDCIYG